MRLLSILSALFFIAACSSQSETAENNEAMVEAVEPQKDSVHTGVVSADQIAVKVYITADGKITADGEAVTLEDLDKRFAELESKNAVVYYARDNIESDPAAEAMKVLELVMQRGLSLRFYTDKTFTTPFEPK